MLNRAKFVQGFASCGGCRFDPPSSSVERESYTPSIAVFFVLDRSLFQTSTYNVVRSPVMWGRLKFAEKTHSGNSHRRLTGQGTLAQFRRVKEYCWASHPARWLAGSAGGIHCALACSRPRRQPARPELSQARPACSQPRGPAGFVRGSWKSIPGPKKSDFPDDPALKK